MKYQITILAISLTFFVGCTGGTSFSEFPTQSTLTIETGNYENVAGKTTSFREYLTPYGKVEQGEMIILFGFIFHEIDWIEGVAYLVDQNEKVLDTLIVSGIDPPSERWAKLETILLVMENGGMMEEGPLPPGRTDTYWVDTLKYRIGNSRFELVE